MDFHFEILDLVDTWELLLSDLNKKLGQCITYNKINQDIEQFTIHLDTVAKDRAELDMDEETDVFKQMEDLKVTILKSLEMKSVKDYESSDWPVDHS